MVVPIYLFILINRLQGNEALSSLLEQLNEDIRLLENQLHFNVISDGLTESKPYSNYSADVPQGGGSGETEWFGIRRMHNNNDNDDEFELPPHEVWMNCVRDDRAV